MSTSPISSATNFDAVVIWRDRDKKPEKPAEAVEQPKDWVSIGKDGRTYVGSEANNLVNVVPGSGEEALKLKEGDTLTATSAAGTTVTTTRSTQTVPPTETAPTVALAEPATPNMDEAEAAKETPAAEPVTKITYSTQLSRADGGSLSINFSDNVRIHEQEKGITAVYFAESNTTRTYGADGTFSEVEGNTIADDVSSIYINTRSEALTTGDGDNLIFNWANNTSITTGNGNDTIVLRDEAIGNSIHTGGGNDTVRGMQVNDSTIDLGEGDNTLAVYGMAQSQVHAGDGNNSVKVNNEQKYYTGGDDFLASTVTLGNGNNSLDIGRASGKSLIRGGNGDNTFTISQIAGSTLDFGDGNNIIKLSTLGEDNSAGIDTVFSKAINKPELEGVATLRLGNGNNKVEINSLERYASVELGNGNNKASLHGLKDDAKVTAGNGNNLVDIYSLSDESSLQLGHGDNTAKITDMFDTSTVEFGNGNNAARIHRALGNGSISFGNGDNGMNAVFLAGDSTVKTGDGNNHIGVEEMSEKSGLNMGEGDNLVFVKAMKDNSNIRSGQGNNLIAVGWTEGDVALESSTHVLKDIAAKERDSVVAEYLRHVNSRAAQGLASPNSALISYSSTIQERLAIEKEYRKRQDDPSYFGDTMDQEQRWKAVRRKLDFSGASEVLWMDLMRDNAPYQPVDTYA